MKVLVTGHAGFIGFHVARQLLRRGGHVVGFDVVNDYYDPLIKEARLELLQYSAYEENREYISIRGDLADRKAVEVCFSDHLFDRVIHLAEQAGGRYSQENTYSYIQSNLVAFTHHIVTCLNTISTNLFKLYTRLK